MTALGHTIQPLPPFEGNRSALQQSLNRLKHSLPVFWDRLMGASHHKPVHHPVAQGHPHQIALLQTQVRICLISKNTPLSTDVQPDVDQRTIS